MNSDMETLLRERLIIIARGIEPGLLLEASHALSKAGISMLESTFDHAGSDPVADNARKIRTLVKELGNLMLFGAGTVLNVREVQAAFDAGARYIVSPCTNEAVIREAKRLGMLSVPGAMTPTEVSCAWDMGADIVKLFPAGDLGMGYIRNLRGPFPHIPLLATGGVNPETIPAFFKAGVTAVATGITVFRPDLVLLKDAEGIAALAGTHLDAVRASAA